MPRVRPLALLLLALACSPRDPPGDDTAASDGSTTTTTASAGTTAAPTTSGAVTTTTGTTAPECTTFDPNDCTAAVRKVEILAPDIVFALDESSLMGSVLWDHDADDADDDGVSDLDPNQPATPKIARWPSLHRAVEFTLESFDASIHAGLALYPSLAATDDYGAAACASDPELAVHIAPHSGAAILAAMPPEQAGDLAGAVPGAAAIAAATAEHLSLPDAVPRHIVYVTGGAANCHAGAANTTALLETYDDDLPLRVGEALAAGVVTHVVGVAIPDATSPTQQDGRPDATNNFTRLNELADLGGAALPGPTRFHAAADEAALTAALAAIVRAQLSCTVPLDPPPAHPELFGVAVAGVDYGETRVVDCGVEDGWRFVDAATIELCGQACRDFQAEGSLDADYDCPPDPCG